MKIKGLAADICMDIIGAICSSIGIYIFARTGDFATGGISGLALMIYHLWRVPMGISTILLNLPLVILSYHHLGKAFLLRSLRGMLFCTFFLDTVFPHLPFYSGSKLLSALFSGVFIGLGLAIFYMRGSSSGGTDFLTMSIKVIKPHLSIGFVTLSIDLVIISLGWVVFGDIDAVLYGLISTYVTSVVIDKMMYRIGASKLLIIITGKASEIAQRISIISGRGATLLTAEGAYTHENRSILLCACSNSQAYTIKKVAFESDSGAFIILTDTSEIFGEGFLRKNFV